MFFIQEVLEKENEEPNSLTCFWKFYSRFRSLHLKEYPETRVGFVVCAKFLVTVKIDARSKSCPLWITLHAKHLVYLFLCYLLY